MECNRTNNKQQLHYFAKCQIGKQKKITDEILLEQMHFVNGFKTLQALHHTRASSNPSLHLFWGYFFALFF